MPEMHIIFFHALFFGYVLVHIFLSISCKHFIPCVDDTASKSEETLEWFKGSAHVKNVEKISEVHHAKHHPETSKKMGGYTTLHNEEWYHFVMNVPAGLTLDQAEAFVVDSVLSISFSDGSKNIKEDIELDQAVETQKIQCEIRDEQLHILLPKKHIFSKNTQDASVETSLEDKEVESITQPVEVYERDMSVQISSDHENVYVSIPLEGISKKHLDIEADEQHIYIQSKDTTLMRFKKEIELPYPIMVDEIQVDSNPQSLKLICPRKHHVQKVEIIDQES